MFFQCKIKYSSTKIKNQKDVVNLTCPKLVYCAFIVSAKARDSSIPTVLAEYFQLMYDNPDMELLDIVEFEKYITESYVLSTLCTHEFSLVRSSGNNSILFKLKEKIKEDSKIIACVYHALITEFHKNQESDLCVGIRRQ